MTKHQTKERSQTETVIAILRQTRESEMFRYLVERRHLEQAEKELERLREAVRHWSYCTRQGMLRLCPEKRDELAALMKSCGVEP